MARSTSLARIGCTSEVMRVGEDSKRRARRTSAHVDRIAGPHDPPTIVDEVLSEQHVRTGPPEGAQRSERLLPALPAIGVHVDDLAAVARLPAVEADGPDHELAPVVFRERRRS